MSDEIDFIKPSADTVSKEPHYSLRPRIKNRQHVSKARKLKEESETSKSSENEEDSCDNDDDSVHDQTENKLLRPYAQVNKELKSLKHDHDPQFTNQLNYTKSQLLNKKASEKAFLHESRYKVTSKPGTKCNSNKKTSSGLLCWILIPFMIILLGGSGYLYIVKPSKQLIIQDNLLHRWKESYSNLVIKYGDVLSETSRKIIKTSIEMISNKARIKREEENLEITSIIPNFKPIGVQVIIHLSGSGFADQTADQLTIEIGGDHCILKRKLDDTLASFDCPAGAQKVPAVLEAVIMLKGKKLNSFKFKIIPSPEFYKTPEHPVSVYDTTKCKINFKGSSFNSLYNPKIQIVGNNFKSDLENCSLINWTTHTNMECIIPAYTQRSSNDPIIFDVIIYSHEIPLPSQFFQEPIKFQLLGDPTISGSFYENGTVYFPWTVPFLYELPFIIFQSQGQMLQATSDGDVAQIIRLGCNVVAVNLSTIMCQTSESTAGFHAEVKLCDKSFYTDIVEAERDSSLKVIGVAIAALFSGILVSVLFVFLALATYQRTKPLFSESSFNISPSYFHRSALSSFKTPAKITVSKIVGKTLK